jgi:hypothetical protein
VRDLSAKAYGILMAVVQHNVNISAESLSEHFNEGRRSMLSGLKELRDNEYIETKNQRVGNRIIKMSTITEKAERLFFGVNSQVVKSQNSTSVTSNEHIKQNKTYSTVINKPSTSTESRIISEVEEFKKMGYEFFEPTSEPAEDSDDPKLRRIALEAQKKKDYDSGKETKRVSRYQKRHENPIKDWSTSDVCFEFADRIWGHWNIAPWSVTQSKFLGAMGDARRRLGTTSEIEIAAMEIFFSQITLSEYKDAEILWRLFISRLPGLMGQASMTAITDKAKETAKTARELGRRKLRGENV